MLVIFPELSFLRYFRDTRHRLQYSTPAVISSGISGCYYIFDLAMFEIGRYSYVSD
jgi:hypothetical protein